MQFWTVYIPFIHLLLESSNCNLLVHIRLFNSTVNVSDYFPLFQSIILCPPFQPDCIVNVLCSLTSFLQNQSVMNISFIHLRNLLTSKVKLPSTIFDCTGTLLLYEEYVSFISFDFSLFLANNSYLIDIFFWANLYLNHPQNLSLFCDILLAHVIELIISLSDFHMRCAIFISSNILFSDHLTTNYLHGTAVNWALPLCMWNVVSISMISSDFLQFNAAVLCGIGML